MLIVITKIANGGLIDSGESQALTTIGQPGFVLKLTRDRKSRAVSQFEGGLITNNKHPPSWRQLRNAASREIKINPICKHCLAQINRDRPDVFQLEVFKEVTIDEAGADFRCSWISGVKHHFTHD